ncbi:MAG: hypothetical protein ACLQPN_01935 [Bryobacteraceae bacterium]
MMLENAAITRLRGFNLRYFHWLFKVEGDVLVAMQQVQIREVGTGSTRMLEDHEACEGRACRACGWMGQIGRWVTDKALPIHAPLHLKDSEGGRRRSRVRSRFKLASFDSLLEQELPAGHPVCQGAEPLQVIAKNCGLDEASVLHEAPPVANPPIVTTEQREAGMLPIGSPTSDSGRQIPRSARISGGAIVQTHKPGVSKVQQAAKGLGGPPSMESYRHAMQKREEAKILRLITAGRADDARGAGLRGGGGFGFCCDACSVARILASRAVAGMAQPALRIKQGWSAKISASWRVCDSTNSSVPRTLTVDAADQGRPSSGPGRGVRRFGSRLRWHRRHR